MAQARHTYQKELIDQEMQGMKSFFTAEELHGKVLQKEKNIGIATVYRFLKRKVKQKQVHAFQCERKSIYSLSKKSHCHFICEVCGNIEHIDVTSLDFLKKQLKQDVCHVQIDVMGTCISCKQH